MLVPPWERYEDGPTSLRWRMGGGEELIEEWLALWWRLSNDERHAYLSAHPPPAAWKQWLSVVALGGPALRWPKKTKYPS